MSKVVFVILIASIAVFSSPPLKTLEMNDSRVHIPWQEFKDIVERMTYPDTIEDTDTALAPFPYLVSSSRIEGRVVNDQVAHFKVWVTLHIPPSSELAHFGWVKVPLVWVTESSDFAVLRSARLNNKSLSLISSGGSYKALFSKPGTYILVLEYDSPIIERDGVRRMRLSVPKAAGTHLDISVPDTRAEITVNNTECLVNVTAKGTSVSMPVRHDGTISIDYTPLGKAADEKVVNSQMSAKVFATTGMLVIIKENQLVYQFRVDYQIWHKSQNTFTVMLPDTLPIEEVAGAGIKEWRVETTENGPILLVTTNFSPRKNYSFTVHFSERFEVSSETIDIPVMEVLDVDRVNGYIAVKAAETIETFISDSTKGLSAVAQDELPNWLRSYKSLLMRLKYNHPPYRLSLSAKRHADMPVLVAIADEAYFSSIVTKNGYVLSKFSYLIRNNHKQYLRVTAPEKWTLWSAMIDNDAVMPASGEKDGEVLIPLKKMTRTVEGEGFVLELVYWHEQKKMGFSGKINLTTPAIDINCQKINGETWLPEKYNYKRFKGKLEKAAYRVSPPDFLTEKLGTSGRRSQGQTKRRSFLANQQMVVGKKGAAVTLPVEIKIPNDGVQEFFTKNLTVSGESADVSFKYRKEMNVFGRVFKFSLYVLIAILSFVLFSHLLHMEKGSTRTKIGILAGISLIIVVPLLGYLLRLDLLFIVVFGVVLFSTLRYIAQLLQKEVAQ